MNTTKTFSIIFTALLISLSAQALETNNHIKNGIYLSKYFDSMGVLVKNSRISAYSDDYPNDPSIPISRSSFKQTKSGVLYDKQSRQYYCLIEDNSPTREALQRRSFAGLSSYCSKNGWEFPSKNR